MTYSCEKCDRSVPFKDWRCGPCQARFGFGPTVIHLASRREPERIQLAGEGSLATGRTVASRLSPVSSSKNVTPNTRSGMLLGSDPSYLGGN